jgi:hypothetical protein
MRLSIVDRAVLETLLPGGVSSDLPLGVLESGFEKFLDDFREMGAADLQRAFRIALFSAGWIAPLLVLRLPPLSRLSAADGEAALAAMDGSNVAVLRQLVRVLKTVVGLHYGALGSVRRTIGYHS